MLLLRLIKRNILVYIRDRSNIFFSLLSMLIIIGLMVIFLGKMNADGVVDLLGQYGGIRDAELDRANAEQLVIMWTLAGIVVVNSITITLAMVGIMVEDEVHKKLSSFYVSPINRGIFVIAYVIAAVIMGIIMCIATVVIGEAYIGITGGEVFSAAQFGDIFLKIIIIVFSSSTMVFLLANFVHSQSAFSGLSTIVGTLVGFLSAIYLPMGMLPEKVQLVLKCMPMLYASSFMRETFTTDIINTTFAGLPSEALEGYKEYMGITISWSDKVVGDNFKLAFLIISGIIFIVIAAVLQRKRNVMSR